MINILVYGMTQNIGGIENFFINYYRHVDHDNVHFDFLCNYEHMAFENEASMNGDRVYTISPRSKNVFKNKKELQSFFKKNKSYDFCYMMALDLANIDFLKESKKAGIRTRILHSHNSGLKRVNKKNQYIANALHLIHKIHIEKYATDYWACSYAAAKWLFPKRLQNQVKIIHNAIEVNKFKFNPSIRDNVRKREKAESKIIFGHVGRLADQKNPLFLIDVFNNIYEKNNNTELWMVGDGPLRNVIEKKIHELKLDDNIRLFGQRNDVNELMQAMDMFLFPSLFEGLSLVIIEAQAAGLPILASNHLSREHSITNLIIYRSINKPDEWARDALDIARKFQRKDMSSAISFAGYNVDVEFDRIKQVICDNL